MYFRDQWSKALVYFGRYFVIKYQCTIAVAKVRVHGLGGPRRVESCWFPFMGRCASKLYELGAFLFSEHVVKYFGVEVSIAGCERSASKVDQGNGGTRHGGYGERWYKETRL